jgi:hypothetical protein
MGNLTVAMGNLTVAMPTRVVTAQHEGTVEVASGRFAPGHPVI